MAVWTDRQDRSGECETQDYDIGRGCRNHVRDTGDLLFQSGDRIVRICPAGDLCDEVYAPNDPASDEEEDDSPPVTYRRVAAAPAG